jgi:hypothetical protein
VLANTLDLVLGSDKDTHLRTLFGDAKKADELQGFAYEALRTRFSILIWLDKH